MYVKTKLVFVLIKTWLRYHYLSEEDYKAANLSFLYKTKNTHCNQSANSFIHTEVPKTAYISHCLPRRGFVQWLKNCSSSFKRDNLRSYLKLSFNIIVRKAYTTDTEPRSKIYNTAFSIVCSESNLLFCFCYWIQFVSLTKMWRLNGPEQLWEFHPTVERIVVSTFWWVSIFIPHRNSWLAINQKVPEPVSFIFEVSLICVN